MTKVRSKSGAFSIRAETEGCQAMVLDMDARPVEIGGKAASMLQGMAHICDMRPNQSATGEVRQEGGELGLRGVVGGHRARV